MMRTSELITRLHSLGFSYQVIAGEVGVGRLYLHHIIAGRKTASSGLHSRLKSLLQDVIEENLEPERKPYTRVKPIPEQSTHKRREHQVQPTQQRSPRDLPERRVYQVPERRVQTVKIPPRVQPAPRVQRQPTHQVQPAHQKTGCDICHAKVRAIAYPTNPDWYLCNQCAINRGQVPPR